MTYNSRYEEYVDLILRQIVFDLRNTDIFPNENVTYGFYKQWEEDEYPNAIVRFRSDNVTLATREEEGHTFRFEVLATIQGTGNPEEDQDMQIDVMGQIYDAIRNDNTLGDHANWALIRSVDVTFRRDRSYIFFEFLIVIEVFRVW